MMTLLAALGDPTLPGRSEVSPMLDPPTRAVLLMALLAFVILGLGLMLGVILGGRWVRRLDDNKLKTPLPLKRAEATTPEDREPAMLRHTHWNGPADAKAGDTAPTDRQADTKAG